MAYIIKYFSLVLGYKGNKYKGHKWVLIFLKSKGLIKKIRVKNKEKGIE